GARCTRIVLPLKPLPSDPDDSRLSTGCKSRGASDRNASSETADNNTFCASTLLQSRSYHQPFRLTIICSHQKRTSAYDFIINATALQLQFSTRCLCTFYHLNNGLQNESLLLG